MSSAIHWTDGPNAIERSLWDITTLDGADRKYRRPYLRSFPDRFAVALAERYRQTYMQQGLAAANLELGVLAEDLAGSLDLGASDGDIRDLAQARALACWRIKRQVPKSSRDYLYEILADYAARRGIEPPALSAQVTRRGAIARLCDERWWRRRLRVKYGRTFERAAIRLGLVGRRRGLYVSDETVRRCQQQKQRNRWLLESLAATNELGHEFTLAELADLSVSNPRIRRGELMTRIAGFEQVAVTRGDIGIFITVTCPSKMHAQSSVTGQPSPRYDGTTPRQAQKYLARVWARIRAELKRQSISVYGIRVAEPHHDGTPHWHLLLFVDSQDAEALAEICREYALREDPDEPGAAEHRVSVMEIDRTRGTAAGYLAKYVAKNIDGVGLDVGIYGEDPISGAERVSAWASTWGIRQFQQIGGPPVSVWRELRRLESAPPGLIEDARTCADKGDWAGFVDAMGGPGAARADLPIRVARTWRERESRYGEPEGFRVFGVEAGTITVPTRFHEWSIKNAGEAGAQPPWSSVNNCTRTKGALPAYGQVHRQRVA